jgi:hypothetical protein
MHKNYLKFIHKHKESTEDDSEIETDYKAVTRDLDHKTHCKKFMNDQAANWKCDNLQLVKLFQQDLGGEDPFYIPGQEATQPVEEVAFEEKNGKRRKTINDNFIDSAALDDIEALEEYAY